MTAQKTSKFFRSKSFALIAIIIVMIIAFTLGNKNYISAGNISGFMTNISTAGLLAVGMVCLLISGNVDLAAGTEACMAGIFVATILGSGMPWPVALIITILFGAAMGLFNAFLVNVLGFMGFIATIGMSSVYKGLALVVSNGINVSISNQGFYPLGAYSIQMGKFALPLPFIYTVVLFVIYGLILKYTKFGRSIYLIGGNRNAARLAGVSIKKVSTILYINCGAIAAFCGAVSTAKMNSAGPQAISGTEMDSIAGAVLGGVSFMGGSGGLGGAFIGLFLISAFKNGLTAISLPTYWQTVAQGGILLIALVVDYFGERSRVSALKAEAAQAA
ncbi:MAG: ABC transporter permease [Oscillospiraceae bacterium]|jgi:ribose transport system permease protein|nr:ABC transporter permease [Oscillospiraceae bacterium]